MRVVIPDSISLVLFGPTLSWAFPYDTTDSSSSSLFTQWSSTLMNPILWRVTLLMSLIPSNNFYYKKKFALPTSTISE